MCLVTWMRKHKLIVGFLVVLGVAVFGSAASQPAVVAPDTRETWEIGTDWYGKDQVTDYVRPAVVPGVTLAEYNQLREGMTVERVHETIGDVPCKQTLDSEDAFGNLRVVMWLCDGVPSFNDVLLSFHNGKLRGFEQK